ncbi:hypothetical protein GCM10022254_42500 [Actinomadura meridiana]|uniref:Pyrroline-5-carboxylate reductase catalytic N-terminal domain-containing protein n=1 Tax=Actinomadura meridiana TaxID=559626 RepID=A0ABP8C8A9_9ACTN
MRIGVIGAGKIGGNAARLLADAGHEVLLSFSRDPSRLADRATAIGPRARTGTAAEAAAFGDVVILSVPWSAIPAALEEAGPLDGKILIDTTNHFGDLEGLTTAQHNQQRVPGARLRGCWVRGGCCG